MNGMQVFELEVSVMHVQGKPAVLIKTVLVSLLGHRENWYRKFLPCLKICLVGDELMHVDSWTDG